MINELSKSMKLHRNDIKTALKDAITPDNNAITDNDAITPNNYAVTSCTNT